MSRLPRSTLNLKQFMVRKDVLKLYKDIISTLKRIPNETDRKQMIQWTRDDFRKHKHHSDEHVIKMMLTKGRMTLDELRSTIPSS